MTVKILHVINRTQVILILCNITVSEVDLDSIIYKLDTSKATRSDNMLYVKLLEGCKHVLCESPCALLNRSFEEGIFPDEWKMTNITPVYKGKDNQDVTNYRPISLLSVISKIADRCVCIIIYTQLLAED